MAANLVKTGLNVTISNRSADKGDYMADIGAAVSGLEKHCEEMDNAYQRLEVNIEPV